MNVVYRWTVLKQTLSMICYHGLTEPQCIEAMNFKTSIVLKNTQQSE